MTDLLTIKAILTRANVPFEMGTFNDEITIEIDGGKTRGYSMSYATFYFRQDGSLVTVGAGEG